MKTALLAIGTVVMCIIMLGCLPSSSNVVAARVSNSDYTATLSKRDSGATSKGSTLVSLRLNSVADNETHGLIVLGVTGDRAVVMKWVGSNNLALSCASCTGQDVTFEVVKSGDVIVTYDDNLRVH